MNKRGWLDFITDNPTSGSKAVFTRQMIDDWVKLAKEAPIGDPRFQVAKHGHGGGWDDDLGVPQPKGSRGK